MIEREWKDIPFLERRIFIETLLEMFSIYCSYKEDISSGWMRRNCMTERIVELGLADKNIKIFGTKQEISVTQYRLNSKGYDFIVNFINSIFLQAKILNS